MIEATSEEDDYKVDVFPLKLKLDVGIQSQGPPFIPCEAFRDQSSCSQHLRTHTAGTLRSQTLHVKNSASVALSQKLYWIHYVTFGRGGGAVLSMACMKKNKEASVNILRTASPPKKHNASLWRLNVADCVCWRIWKEGVVGVGVGGGCMWCLKSTWLWPKKKEEEEKIIAVDAAGEMMWRHCVIYIVETGRGKTRLL